MLFYGKEEFLSLWKNVDHWRGYNSYWQRCFDQSEVYQKYCPMFRFPYFRLRYRWERIHDQIFQLYKEIHDEEHRQFELSKQFKPFFLKLEPQVKEYGGRIIQEVDGITLLIGPEWQRYDPHDPERNQIKYGWGEKQLGNYANAINEERIWRENNRKVLEERVGYTPERAAALAKEQ